ncbi:hypothetical protein UFOVP276_43 [uncultured Caudovirales phage]|uniref:Uncharacterized protein n=1 Tax=uncultured Caudovirales phage TaxID=2100421 RepID=A0A6J5LPH1_9CAUD|nr:hypothetical protein UFOVP127_180 [uncultured Caudovirales phage]CAB4135000.1 hypothetical protein UFOVP276_43 [uncultured Caudovirales phage]
MIGASFFDELEKISAVLSLQHREKLPSKSFAIPQRAAKRIGVAEGIQGSSKGKYPIHDLSHARAALRVVAMHGTPEEKELVRAKVKAKYPEIGQKTAEVDPDAGGPFITKDRLKRLAIASGQTAAGAGLGWATGEAIKRWVDKSPKRQSAYGKVLPVLGGAATLAAYMHRHKTDNYIRHGKK